MTLRTDVTGIPDDEIIGCCATEKAKAMALALKAGETIAAIARNHDTAPQVVRQHVNKIITQCRSPFPRLSARANQAAVALGAKTLAELKEGVEGKNLPNIGKETVAEIVSAFREGR